MKFIASVLSHFRVITPEVNVSDINSVGFKKIKYIHLIFDHTNFSWKKGNMFLKILL